LDGLERVLRIPRELGYTDKRMTLAMLNPHPRILFPETLLRDKMRITKIFIFISGVGWAK
jgi:hypothetical protein